MRVVCISEVSDRRVGHKHIRSWYHCARSAMNTNSSSGNALCVYVCVRHKLSGPVLEAARGCLPSEVRNKLTFLITTSSFFLA